MEAQLLHVASRAFAESFTDHTGRGVLANKQKACIRSDPAYLTSGFYSIEHRQSNVKQYQIRLQIARHPHGLQPIRNFGNHKLRPLLKELTDYAAEWLVVLRDQDVAVRHQRPQT